MAFRHQNVLFRTHVDNSVTELRPVISRYGIGEENSNISFKVR